MKSEKDNYEARLNDLTKMLNRVITDFEVEHNLKNIDRGTTPLRIRLQSGVWFAVFYKRSYPRYCLYSKELVIYVEFFKMNKDGHRSKLTRVVNIRDILNINPYPF